MYVVCVHGCGHGRELAFALCARHHDQQETQRRYAYPFSQLEIKVLKHEEHVLQWAMKGRFPVGGVNIGGLIWGDPWGGKNAAAAARHVPPPESAVRATAADHQVQMQRAPSARALAFYLPARRRG